MNELPLETATAESWLVFGASGAVGRFLLPQLEARRIDALAVTRHAPPPPAPEAHVRWIQGDLEHASALGSPAVILSLGPLDRFAAWLARVGPASVRRVVAVSSTSVVTKAGSDDAHERALASRLRAAEDAVAEACARRGATWTILRPTLVYGGGADRNLSRLAALARRFGVLPLPAGATGRRQPVHAEDVALAALACVAAPRAANRCYDVPGGEALSYREMVARVLACLPGPPRLIVLPDLVARPLFALASGWMGARAIVARMGDDLVFAADDARRDFGYAPRAFRPEPSMFL